MLFVLLCFFAVHCFNFFFKFSAATSRIKMNVSGLQAYWPHRLKAFAVNEPADIGRILF